MSQSAHDPILKAQRLPTLTLRHLELPTLRGHPHEEASPQETEPFWQQQPEIAYPHATFYPELDLYTDHSIYYLHSSIMDVAHVVIGSKSRFARPTSEVAQAKPKRPRETVKVYLQDDFVGEISLGVPVRFSKLAKDTYPRPAQPTKESEKDADGTKSMTKDEQGRDTPSGGKDWAEMAEQSDDERSRVADVKIAATTQKLQQNDAPIEPLVPKNLSIGVPGVWVQPSVTIAKHILTWMQHNKRTRNNEPLLPLTPVALSKLPLTTLIDTFTGVLAYDLAPFPRDLRHEILTRLTQQPTNVDQMRYLYERLPVEDPIVNRMVTSFFEHSEAGKYTQEEIDEVYEYIHEEVDDAGGLERHFDRVRRSRARKQTRVTAMEKLREGFENFAGPMAEALIADAEVEKPAPKDEGDGHRRRNRREKQQGQANAKATGGKGKAL